MSQVLEHQIPILEQLAKDRDKGKTLVVIPSGAGKTHIAAFDSKQAKAKSILYIAHRSEILSQAAEIFKRIHKLSPKDYGFIDQSTKDYDKEVIFASNQTLAKPKNLERLEGKVWDYVVVDEFHHVPAITYQRILENTQYKFLLGLTATPFRLDQKNIMEHVDNNISYNIDLEEGIKKEILVPFVYNGLYDNIDYSDIEWLGYKYRENDLNKKLLIDKRDNQIIQEFRNYCGSRSTIGFCVSVKHCERITNQFLKSGISAKYITHYTPMFERHAIVEQFKHKMFQVLFVRDVFNEGIDFPFVEALLFLRPTWSKTVFLQQLGRGLRKLQGKDEVIVLDFIGNYHNAFQLREWLGFAKKSETSLYHKPTKPLYEYEVASVYFDKTLIDIFDEQRRASFKGKYILPLTKQDLIDEYFRYKKDLISRGVISADTILKKPNLIGTRFFHWRYGAKISRNQYLKFWPTWSAFIKEIGEDEERRKLIKEEMKKEYFRVKEKLGRIPHGEDFKGDNAERNECKYHLSSICRYFGGSWTKFLTTMNEIIPMKEQLISNYYEIKNKLGRRPTILELTDKKLSKWGDGAYNIYFGNYTKFLKSLGEIPKNATSYSKGVRDRRSPRAFDTTKRIEETTKRRLMARYLEEKQKSPNGQVSYDWYEKGPDSSIRKYWGGWNEFLKFMNDLPSTITLHCKSCNDPIIVPFNYRGAKKTRRCSNCRRTRNTEQHREYSKKHREHINQFAREWRKKNPGYHTNRYQSRKDKK